MSTKLISPRSSLHKYHKLVFRADLTVLRLITNFMSRKCYRDSYLREFCAQVSQIVVSKLIWPFYRLIRNLSSKFTQNSYLREFCAQVSKIEFLAELTVLRLVTTVWARITAKLISPRDLCTSIKKSMFFELIWLFYGLLLLYEKKYHETHISAQVLCTSIRDRVSSWIDCFIAY